jgi:hypothetical protein
MTELPAAIPGQKHCNHGVRETMYALCRQGGSSNLPRGTAESTRSPRALGVPHRHFMTTRFEVGFTRIRTDAKSHKYRASSRNGRGSPLQGAPDTRPAWRSIGPCHGANQTTCKSRGRKRGTRSNHRRPRRIARSHHRGNSGRAGRRSWNISRVNYGERDLLERHL